MKLVVAEKPSVAQSLAAVLGAKQKKQGYLEGGGFLVSWCVGHLVTMSYPEAYDPALRRWSLQTLPLIRYSLSPERYNFLVTLTSSNSTGSL